MCLSRHPANNKACHICWDNHLTKFSTRRFELLALDLAWKLEITEAIYRKTSKQRNWQNIPSSHPIDQEDCSHCILLRDSLIVKCKIDFLMEDHYASHLICLIPSIIVNKTLKLHDVRRHVVLGKQLLWK